MFYIEDGINGVRLSHLTHLWKVPDNVTSRLIGLSENVEEEGWHPVDFVDGFLSQKQLGKETQIVAELLWW